MIRVAILAAAFALAAQCTSVPKPAPAPVPTVLVDAAPEPDADIDAAKRSPCALACAHLADLKCPAAQPTPGGATCTQVCENGESGPAGTSLDPACVVKQTTCPKAMACQ